MRIHKIGWGRLLFCLLVSLKPPSSIYPTISVHFNALQLLRLVLQFLSLSVKLFCGDSDKIICFYLSPANRIQKVWFTEGGSLLPGGWPSGPVINLMDRRQLWGRPTDSWPCCFLRWQKASWLWGLSHNHLHWVGAAPTGLGRKRVPSQALPTTSTGRLQPALHGDPRGPGTVWLFTVSCLWWLLAASNNVQWWRWKDSPDTLFPGHMCWDTTLHGSFIFYVFLFGSHWLPHTRGHLFKHVCIYSEESWKAETVSLSRTYCSCSKICFPQPQVSSPLTRPTPCVGILWPSYHPVGFEAQGTGTKCWYSGYCFCCER